MKSKFAKATIAAGLVAGAAVLTFVGKPSQHIAPEYLYPNPQYTTGLAETLTASDLTKSYGGQTYSQSHRLVTDATKNLVRQEYATTTEVVKTGEVDHFYPLCAGGSNDPRNLWLQPGHLYWNGQDFGFHTKDKLETYVCAQIKAGKLDPKVAFAGITGDWVKFYLQIFPQGTAAGIPDDSESPVE